jgi:hypothetical protein
MKLQMVIIKDVRLNVYNAPNYVPHLGMAIRGFEDECKSKDPKSMVAAHPVDFELWHIGEYDDCDLSQCRFFTESERNRLAQGANHANVA